MSSGTTILYPATLYIFSIRTNKSLYWEFMISRVDRSIVDHTNYESYDGFRAVIIWNQGEPISNYKSIYTNYDGPISYQIALL